MQIKVCIGRKGGKWRRKKECGQYGLEGKRKVRREGGREGGREGKDDHVPSQVVLTKYVFFVFFLVVIFLAMGSDNY